MRINSYIKKIHHEKINVVLLVIAFVGIALCIAVFIPAVRSIIIAAEESQLGRQINHEHWSRELVEMAWAGLFECAVILVIVIRKCPVIYNTFVALKKYLNNHTRLIVTLFFILMAINFLKFLDLQVTGTGLDFSWGWAINNLAYNRGLYTFGKDVTFTYGPLGYLFKGQYYGKTIIQGIGLNVFCIGSILVLFYLNYRKNLYSIRKLFIFSLLLFIFPGIVPFEWIWNIMLFLLFSTCYYLQEDKRIHFPLIICAGFLSAFSLLLKFNTAVLAVALAGVLGIMFLLYSHKRQFIGYICLFSAAYIAFTAGSIVVCFKNIDNFIIWVKMSLEVAGGFSSAMAVTGLLPYLIVAILIIIMYLRFTYMQRKEPVFVLCIIGLVILFFSFKHGFVRQDDGHMVSFFSTIPFLTGFLFLFSPQNTYKRSRFMFQTTAILCFLCIINSIFILTVIKGIFRNTYFITQLVENYQTFNERKTEALRGDILPAEWNGEIENNSIQILSWELNYAAANHWDGWQPNPVLQLYNAYTKKLDEYSARAFTEEKAPQFILLEYKSLDRRNMFIDTPATWNAIFPNYIIARQDESRLLLSKKDTHKSLNFVPLFSRVYKFNETIPVPESLDPVYAKIVIRDSFLGKIIMMLFRGNPPNMTVKYQDGTEQRFRIITDTLQNPVMINYIPHNFEQTAIFFNFEETEEKELRLFAVKEIKITKTAPFLYKKNMTVEWYSLTK
jgi:hypothetical protein